MVNMMKRSYYEKHQYAKHRTAFAILLIVIIAIAIFGAIFGIDYIDRMRCADTFHYHDSHFYANSETLYFTGVNYNSGWHKYHCTLCNYDGLVKYQDIY